jgi:hypothetical protein
LALAAAEAEVPAAAAPLPSSAAIFCVQPGAKGSAGNVLLVMLGADHGACSSTAAGLKLAQVVRLSMLWQTPGSISEQEMLGLHEMQSLAHPA